MKRGEIWLVNFDPTIGSEIKKTRPAIILSSQPFNRLRRTLVVVPLSSTHDQTEFPFQVLREIRRKVIRGTDVLGIAVSEGSPRDGFIGDRELDFDTIGQLPT